MRVLIREPIDQPLQLKEIEATIPELQDLVGGFIQIIRMTEDICCICNEEGTSLGLENNFYYDPLGWITGICIFTSTDSQEFTSLTDKQIEYISKYIGFPVV
ncbi:MAG TPA: DUF3846 domain-containing protein [Desulfosporosinus sp.]|nr:DUF3846 domain-containing protein [Desulfosporosinus sp.]